MPTTQDEARERITKLVARYQALTPSQKKDFNEENTKKDFVEPLFGALGWDIYNSQEVAAEEKASGKRVDYAFKLQGVARFLVEVKPLRADLNREDHIKQAVTYAYNKGITWAVLTDFEGLRLFNAQTGRPCINLSCQDYLSSFDDLWRLSRESVESRALEEWAQKYGHMPPALPVEQRLFRQLRDWREELSTQLHLHNPQLNTGQVDEVILRFFNRLIFIRTAEDRGLEEYPLRAALHQWQGQHGKGELVDELRRIFSYFNGYYDSELFKPHLADQVFVEGPTIERIIEGLYQPSGLLAAYDFAVIDADVLGAVYEQYLGQVTVIVKQRAKQAQMKMQLGLPQDVSYETEANKRRRKEMGIYYTPKWVTEYIVAQTVRRFLKEKNHNEILNMRILDPACGSGSFLIKAYDALLHYHAQVKGKSVTELDQFDRLPVLTGNIFGVDLDEQAVEIARLNLLIRSLAKRDILPPLSDNVKQGNSLVSGSEAELKPFFGDDWQAKKPFNWEQEFQGIMSKGGFDVVIGNPPYVKIQSLPREDADYFRDHYQSAHGSFDIYILFLEKAIKLLNPGGRLGFICSSKFLKSQYGKKIQGLLQRDCTVESIVDLSALKVFAEATTYPVIIVFKKGATDSALRYVSVPEEEGDSLSAAGLNALPTILAKQNAITGGVWPPPTTQKDSLMGKLSKRSTTLGEVADRVFQGLKTSADAIYTFKPVEAHGDTTIVLTQSKKQVELESSLLRPLIKGGQMHRYHIGHPELVILFPYIEGKLIHSDHLEQNYPRVWKYLLANKGLLENREHNAFKGERWYQFGRNQALDTMHLPKLVTPDFAPSARFSWDKEGQYCFNGGTAGGYGLIMPAGVSPLFTLGLVNSRPLDWYLHRISTTFQGGWFSYEARFIKRLPIRRINPSNKSDKKLHDDLVSLVERMLELHQKLVPLHDTPSLERDQLQHQIELTDQEIDDLVYDLYGLTDKERKIVQDSFK